MTSNGMPRRAQLLCKPASRPPLRRFTTDVGAQGSGGTQKAVELTSTKCCSANAALICRPHSEDKSTSFRAFCAAEAMRWAMLRLMLPHAIPLMAISVTSPLSVSWIGGRDVSFGNDTTSKSTLPPPCNTGCEI